jgi:hypothetical protein
MSDNVLKEFLVGLGFKVDDSSFKKFQKGTLEATAVVEALAVAVAATAVAVTAAVIKMADNFDTLYWQSKRLGSSAADIKSYGYAMSQLGGSVQGAQSAMEGIAQFERQYGAGADGFLVGKLGVNPAHLHNAKEMLVDIGNTLKRMPTTQQYAYGNMLGIDPIQLQAMLRDTGAYEKQYKDFARSLGIDLDEASDQSNKFMMSLRKAKAEFGLMFDAATLKVLEWMVPKLQSLVETVQHLSSSFGKLTKDVGDFLALWDKLTGTTSESDDKFFGDLISDTDNVINNLKKIVQVMIDIKNGDWKQARLDFVSLFDPNVNAAQFKQNDSGWNPNAGVSGSGSVKDKATLDRAAQASSYFQSKEAGLGLNAQQAAGLTSGLFAESGLNPNALNKGYTDKKGLWHGGGAAGIGQWLGKRAKLFKELFHHTIGQSSFGEQLQFVAYELKHKEGKALRVLLGSTLAGQAAMAEIYKYERPAKGAESTGDEHRAAALINSGVFGKTYLAGSKGNGSVVINQKTDIHANGNDSKKLASDVAAHQTDVNQKLVTNASVFAY